MVRYIVMLAICMSSLLLTSVSYKKVQTKSAKKYCRGYSVIEADKGIDCSGDTIKLVKANGFFQRANL
jgi:hypothetical protein